MELVTTFASASAITALGNGQYGVEVSADWAIAGNPNGGYLLAMMADAVGSSLSDHRHPLAVSAHYLGAPSPGHARIDVEVLRTGRNASQARAVLWQGERRCVEALLTMGHLDASVPPTWTDLPPDPIAPVAKCFRLPAKTPDGVEVTIMNHVLIHADPADLGWALGKPNGAALIRGWVELPADEAFTPASLLYAADSLPPATLSLGSVGWVPTFELTVYIRAIPVPGPVQVSQRAHLIDAGRVEETCTVWDSAGRLVAQATQLAGVRMKTD